MNTALLSHFLKQFFPLAAFVVVLATFLWSGSMGMPQDTTGQMSSCPIMGVVALCEMSPLVHVAKWQNLFSALPERGGALFLAIVALSLSMIFLLRRARYSPGLFVVPLWMLGSKAVSIPIPSTLQEAFSDGILNPKIF